jgi:hypothetical protein
MTEEPDIVERLRNYNTCSDTDVDEAADEIERLRKERDEARREVMSWISDQACRFEDIDREYAERGWEYLKENA